MGTAIYTRVSTDEQVNGFGLEVQRDKCLAYAKFKDWQVTHEFSDEGISGSLDESKRPGLANLLAAIDAGEIDTLIIASLDRLARKLSVLLQLKEKLDKMNVTFSSCKETIDTSTPTGIAMMQMIGVFAEWERNVITARMTDGRNARGRVDGERGGRMPLGYRRNGDGVEIVKSEAEIVKQIFWMRQDGSILQGIADWLNEYGIPSKKGKQWYAKTVSLVLKNEEKYRGGVRYLSPVCWPEILST